MLLRLLAILMMVWAGAASAHEVRPAIGDLSVADGRMSLQLQMSAEALVAGVDLDGLADTNDSDRAEAYDAARALDPEALAARVREAFPAMQDKLIVTAGDAPVALTLDNVEVAPVGNVDLARDSTLTLTGSVPAGAQSLTVTWPAGWGAMILRQQAVDDPFTGYLAGGETSEPIPLDGGIDKGWGATFFEYIPVGYDHILPKGLDHILFVLGLFFLTPALRPLLIQISLFTVAHTVTLALGALKIVEVPGSIVEPLIALSIAYVAFENMFTDGLNRWRPFVIFGFGLLHGLGFASVLSEFGLPPGHFVSALIGFNIGVELGQITVIVVAWVLCRIAMREAGRGDAGRPLALGYLVAAVIAVPAVAFALNAAVPGLDFADLGLLFAAASALCALCAGAMVSWDNEAYRRSVEIPASALIGLVGVWWVIERVLL
ncbi:HupE/UreJ family protein [Pseudaestuariivita atlantica]|uniref:HupE / UreJ protein n=1 Tax=Pseudaestuariivita atlantica TaxID=1317121 RepID=A0A0L1JMH7_9RHOB|nr:HupE/UreJ family protein [Pseudaestuariivita atlantica]KNG92949.1 hypothetical protein ATO11_13510 [Pseudaestuariivita atlantica]